MTTLVFDIEADGLLYAAKKIHCIVIFNRDNKQLISYYDDKRVTHASWGGSIKEGVAILEKATALICHNYYGYDKLLLEKLYAFSTQAKGVDTQVLSYLYYPDREWGHSVAAWMQHLALPGQKVANEDWSSLSLNMLERCLTDTIAHDRIEKALVKEALEDKSVNWERAIDIENKIAYYCAKQELNGVLFDKEAAEIDIAKISLLCEETENKIAPLLRKEAISSHTTAVNNPFKKDGTYSFSVKTWYPEEEIEQVSGPFSRIVWEVPALSSREKLKKQLVRCGWKPRYFTEKGSPQFTVTNEYGEKVACESLKESLGELGEELATYIVLRHRQSQIKGWVSNGHIRDDGRIPAGVIPNATNTHRAAHRVVANVPRSSSIFGKEMRGYFKAPPGKKIVGSDLSGLELRCLANRMKDPEYIATLLSGDIHWHHAIMGGFVNAIPYNAEDVALKKIRDKAKKFIYTFIYGAGDDKIASTIGVSKKEVAGVRKTFLNSLPALANFLRLAKEASKKGWLRALDGRKVWMRRGDNNKVLEHKAPNTILQCDGALVAKYSLALIDERILSKKEYEAKAVIWYHDEVQIEVLEQYAQEVGEKIVQCFKDAGAGLGFTCPIDGEYKIGNNWKETH